MEAGRFSRPVGSGRLIGAEAFRNTSSVYDGVNVSLGTRRWTAQLFYFHPVLYTYPNVRVNPLFRDARIGGVNYSYHWKTNTLLEGFVIHNHDGASASAATRRDYLSEGGASLPKPPGGSIKPRVRISTVVWEYCCIEHGSRTVEARYSPEIAGDRGSPCNTTTRRRSGSWCGCQQYL